MPERAEWRQLIEQRTARQHRELLQFTRRLALLLAALVAIVVAGTVGYALIEGTSILYAASWTLDTVTTLGTPQSRVVGSGAPIRRAACANSQPARLIHTSTTSPT